VAPELVPKSAGKCEFDRHGDKTTGAVSLSRKLHDREIRDLIEGRKSLADELSPPQIRYLRDAIRVWPLPSGLRPLGPIELRGYRTGDGRYDVDVWTLPAGAHDIEISRKVREADAEPAWRTMHDDLARAGVTVCADQSAQTAPRLRALLNPR